MPSLVHSFIQAKLIAILIQLSLYNVHSELTININGKDYTPDIVLYPLQKIDLLDDVIKMSDLPLLAIEILSPTQGTMEITDKFKLYFEAGIQSCWLVQPALQSILVCSSFHNRTTFSHGEFVDETLKICFPLENLFS
ncbi:Uma2 family endonuclease [Anaerolineales bacterium HSG6]|nr:Uma2 family endonuclease [Anaerolineales bacterium HSG6]MDM8529843.1 Uma2 family endonuclease [Anaerolineales bacterium HSG25]